MFYSVTEVSKYESKALTHFGYIPRAESWRKWKTMTMYRYVHHMKGNTAGKRITLAEEFATWLEEIPDGGAECFPFETIDEMKQEYLSV